MPVSSVRITEPAATSSPERAAPNCSAPAALSCTAASRTSRRAGAAALDGRASMRAKPAAAISEAAPAKYADLRAAENPALPVPLICPLSSHSE